MLSDCNNKRYIKAEYYYYYYHFALIYLRSGMSALSTAMSVHLEDLSITAETEEEGQLMEVNLGGGGGVHKAFFQ